MTVTLFKCAHVVAQFSVTAAKMACATRKLGIVELCDYARA